MVKGSECVSHRCAYMERSFLLRCLPLILARIVVDRYYMVIGESK